ncbi:MAG: hypothetical protein BWK76_03420 [Desulfobulbaceae bacterium A2]|nr:MAG: hypothetical protein BWK76_03420 [Desulfobulbaceae bacterium A2]
MRCVVALCTLLCAVALVVLAWEYRTPAFVALRPWLLPGLLVGSVVLVGLYSMQLRRTASDRRLLRGLGFLGLLAAVLALTVTLVGEGRFQWLRRQVLTAEPAALERLGRHVIVGFERLEDMQRLVRLRAVAGVFLAGRNVRGLDVARVRAMIDSLQQIRREQGLPLLWIAADQEGGVVSHLSPPLPRLPPLADLVARAPDATTLEAAVRDYAVSQAQGLVQVGVNLNFAPVVDLNHAIVNPADRYTKIYQRAIGRDPALVARVAGWYCQGLEQAGVRCTLKHFPGLGRVFEDTHRQAASLATPLDELAASDLLPFRSVLGETGAFTMLSHLRLAAVDAAQPVSTSGVVVQGLLRGAWGHDGVLITDNCTMAAIYHSEFGIEGAAVQALNAGVDLLLISWDSSQFYPVMHALLQAERAGTLDTEALRRSARRLQRAGMPLPDPGLKSAVP